MIYEVERFPPHNNPTVRAPYDAAQPPALGSRVRVRARATGEVLDGVVSAREEVRVSKLDGTGSERFTVAIQLEYEREDEQRCRECHVHVGALHRVGCPLMEDSPTVLYEQTPGAALQEGDRG